MEDERLTKINQERDAALQQSNDTYNAILQDNQNLYNQQQQYANDYLNTQNEMLDKQLAFNQEQIEKQKEIARQNMETEQKKAKNDYTQFINPYGYRNENLAERGLLKSGVSETSMLGGFNTYQNRLASANKAMQDAFVQYDTDMNAARLNNDVQKAQNALNALKMNLEFAETFYTNKSNTMQNQLSNNQNIDNNYYNRYQTEYGNIQNEKERAEQIRQWEAELAEKQRQYNETLAFQKQQAEQEQANWEKQYALSKSASSSSSSSSRSRSSSSSGGSGGTSLTGTTTSANGYTIIANPFTGAVNPDAKYGVFNTGDGSGYQPNNINGEALKYSGMTMAEFTGEKGSLNSGNKNIDNHKVWQIGNKYYVWDGYANGYVDITRYNVKNKSNPSGGKGAFGSGSMGGTR